MTKQTPQKWLLIFYSVPSHPVSNRMKIWRKLAKAGAVQLKGAVYILPETDEHYELFQWLISEVSSMGGDGAFISTEKIETMKTGDIIALFNKQREQDYRGLENTLSDLERRVESIRKGSKNVDARNVAALSGKLFSEFAEIRKMDFFSSKAGEALNARFLTIDAELKKVASFIVQAPPALKHKRTQDYANRTWVTREKPFVDRMASAWLIRKFIDRQARFTFSSDKQPAGRTGESISYDMQDADFTHRGDLCTVEVLMKTFGIKDKTAKKIAEIVHDLDVKDERYNHPETPGLEEILKGIRRTGKSDSETLEQGMAVFEMLYAAKT